MRILVLLCLALLIGHTSFSQKYSFVPYSTEEGLPQSQVTAIGQDKDGYLWVGTLGGLAKFNGRDFVTFSHDDGLWNNRVTSITSIDGDLWIGHDGGISIIKNNTISKFGFTGADQTRKVSAIVKFKGRILVCTTLGAMFEFKNESLESITPESDDVEIMRIRGAHVSHGALYLATRRGLLKTTDLKSFAPLKSVGLHNFYQVTGNDNKLVIAEREGKLYTIDHKSGVKKTFDFDSLLVTGCYIDNEERIWVNTDLGIAKIKGDEVMMLDDISGLPVNKTSCFFQDRNSNIWVGSKGKGIFRFPGLSFVYYDQETGFPTDLFMNGFQKRNGDYYFGTYDKGIVKKSRDGRVSWLGPGEDFVWASVYSVDGKDWFGCQSSLVSIGPNDQIKVYSKADGIPGKKIVSFYRIDRHSMYVGGEEGMALYKNGKFTKLGTRDKDYLGTVRDIEVVNGRIFCVGNLGLFEFKNNDFYKINLDYLETEVFFSIQADSYGNVWLGAEEGLFVMKNGKISQVKLLDDDPSSNFINFLNYKDKKLFVGTNNGLFVLENLNGKPSFVRYGISDGIPDLETNLNSGFFDNKGDFWFGTASGLVCFQDEIERLKPAAPTANLVSILLNYDQFDYLKYSEELDENGLPVKLILPHSKNNLIFKLDGVSLVHHRGLRYQFWLEGLNDDWSPLSEVSTITFNNLPAGDYVLHMRVVDRDGRMSDEVSVPFVINEAFYKTWWFILLIALCVAGVILLVFRLRLRRINELNEKEKLVFKSRLLSLEQKSVNASMNRHFIFNALNSIQYFINTRDRLAANKYLTNFAQLIRKNLDTATSDQNTISLEEEIERLKLYLSLESMRFKDRFEYEITTGDIDLESIEIPAMLMQPFIENSIIHGILPDESIKGIISIRMEVQDDVLEIIIEDNGIGVNQSIARKGEFDGDHRSQGMEITSKRIDLIQKYSDKSISMEGPTEIVGSDGSINGTRVLIKMTVTNLVD